MSDPRSLRRVIRDVVEQVFLHIAEALARIRPNLRYLLPDQVVRFAFGDVEVLPFRWFDKARDLRGTPLTPAELTISHGPRSASGQVSARVSLPEVTAHVIERALVHGHASSVRRGGELLIERVPGHPGRRTNAATGWIRRHGQRVAVIDQLPRHELAGGIFLGGNGPLNYFHLMIEILPKLAYVGLLEPSLQALPLLVPSGVLEHANLGRALDLAAPGTTRIGLAPNLAYEVKELVYLTSPSITQFNLRRGRPSPSDTLLRPSTVEFWRKRAATFMRSDRTLPKRLFLARHPERRRYNQDEVVATLSRMGFTTVYLEDEPLERQIALMANAQLIVGPTGAAWTNLLFCMRGTRAVCWMPREAAGFSAYSSLAHSVGCKLEYVFYQGNGSHTADFYLNDYVVDADMVAEAVVALGST